MDERSNEKEEVKKKVTRERAGKSERASEADKGRSSILRPF